VAPAAAGQGGQASTAAAVQQEQVSTAHQSKYCKMPVSGEGKAFMSGQEERRSAADVVQQE